MYKLVKKEKLREINLYLVFGVLTTIINIICYEFLCDLSVEYKLANTLSFIIAVSFSYITNKIFVFKSGSKNSLDNLLEFIRFIFYRIATYLIEFVSLITLVEGLGGDKSFSKWFVTIVVIILNYIFSKKRIFREREL